MNRRRLPLRLLASATILALALPRAAVAENWQPAPPFPDAPQPRLYPAAVNLDGTLYALGGPPWRNGNDQDGSVHALAAGASSWTPMPPLSGMGPVIHPGAGIDNLHRIVIFGGLNLDNGDPGEGKVYDPAEGPTASIAERSGPADLLAWCTGDDGLVYAFGGGPGLDASPADRNSRIAERYDASFNMWESLTPMPAGVADAAAVDDGRGHVLVIGGFVETGGARTANVARYDLAAHAWSDTAVPDLPVALSGLRAVRGADHRIYAIGGVSGDGAGTVENRVWILNLDTNTWTEGPTMLTPRQQFAAALADDDFIYAAGGDDGAGGTHLVEKLYTPPCPIFTTQPQNVAAWNGTIAAFSITATGGAPIAYQWRRNGQNLADGPTGTGSSLSGTTTAALLITSPGPADAGDYDCLASNACGATVSDAATLTIRMPPAIPATWSVTNLHPAWAQSSSYAYGVSEGRIGGEAFTPTLLPDGRTLTLAHPVLWSAPSWTPADLTPGGSVGGGILDLKGTYLVGWFWHTYQCWSGGQWWTCGWRSAGYWAGDPPAFTEVHVSGAEYDSVTATDGQRMVGTVTWEYSEGNYFSNAYLWAPPAFGGISLHPGSAASDSSASAIDGTNQYGIINSPYPNHSVHAAMWSGSAASVVDLHPAGFNRSSIYGAGDGQPVGTAYLPTDVPHALLWAGAPGAIVDLHPSGATSSIALDAEGGLQVGNVDGRAALWAGSPASFVDLGAFVPAGFAGSTAEGVEVAPDGAILVVGSGYNTATGRTEALVWRSVPTLLGDANCDGAVDALDVQPFVLLLVDPAAYAAAYPDCDPARCDMNNDGLINAADIQPFLSALLAPP